MNDIVENRLVEKIHRLEQDVRDANSRFAELQSFVLDENLTYQFVTWKVKKRLEQS